MSLSEHPDAVQHSMTEFFKQKTQEQNQKTERSQSEKHLTEVINQAQADANMSNFFNANRERGHEKTDGHHKITSYSPQKKTKTDPKSLFSRKGVTDREKEQAFLEYYDENLKLRQNQTKLEQHIKELKTKVRVIEGEYTYSKKKFEGDQATKEDLRFIEELRRENDSLKAQLKDAHYPKPSLPSGSKQKVIVKSTAPKSGVSSKTNSDHLRLIDLLKTQLKKAENEISALHNQLSHKGHGGSAGLGQSDMHDRNVKVATLQHRFENLDVAFTSQKNMLEKNNKMMEDLNRQLYQERTRNNQLEVQLRSAELAAATAKDLQLQLDEVEREKKMLEAKYKDLVESPFFKDVAEKAANPARLREAENQLAELKAQVKSLNDQNTANEKLIIDLKAQAKTTAIEREKLKDEKTKAEAILQEKERTQGFLDKQMEIFNISNDRERDNFLKALGMVRLQGEEPAWKRLEFIERHGELDINNVPSLLKEIDRLRIEKSEIAAQLEKAQTLLHTHLEMEKEKEIISKAETDKLQLQLKSSNNRIEELTKLADFRARNYRDNMLKSGISFKPYEEGASEFSEITESELATTENTLDVLVRNVELDELMLRKMLAGKVMELEGLQTMVAVDFYNHETQNSEICEGMKPNYNFQVAYKVNVDENLITYMENEFLRVEIYGVVHGDLKLLGTAYASFRELLIKNYDVQYGSSAVVTVNPIIYGESKSEVLGVMKLKLRMRHPISEALRWIKERAEFLKDTQDQLDIRMDPTLKSRKVIIQVDKVSGLDNKRASTFVFYKLYNLRDNYTPTIAGHEPVFNHISTHDLVQNESVRHYLERESLEFVLFDDAQPLLRNETRVQSTQLGDVIGRGKVRLSPLLENQPIDQYISIMNIRGAKVATLHVRIYWFDQHNKIPPGDDASNLTKIWEENMTRNIAQALRVKGQNLESAFHIFDSDGDQRISFEEFRDAVLRTFKVKTKEEEIAMYWKRLNLMNGNLYKEEFFNRLSPYMSAEENMRATQQRLSMLQQGSPGKPPQIGQLISKNSQDIYNKFDKNNEIFNLLCKRMAKHIRENNLPIDYYLNKFDKNANGYISRQEMRTGLFELGLNLSESDIESLLLYFDINNDNMVSTEEFKVLVRSGIIEELQKDRYSVTKSPTLGSPGSAHGLPTRSSSLRVESSVQETRQEVMKFICDHVRQNNMTLLSFTKSLDADNSGTLKRDELTAFFKKIGMKIEQNELEALFEELDPKKTNNVPTKKFIEVLQPYIKEKPKMTSGIEQALALIANYMLDHKTDPYTYFNKFDSNKNGFIERRELKTQIQDMGILITDIELNNLLNFFDDNQDGRISSKEFTSHLTPYLNTAKKTRSQGTGDTPSSKIVDDLKLKCHTLVRQNSHDLKKGFDLLKDNLGTVSKENFKKVMTMYNLGFVPAELDLIVDYFTEKNGEGLVLYERFLKSYSDPNFDAGVSESMVLSSYGGEKTLKRLSSAEEIFSRMSKVLKQNKISSKEAFKIFDKDGSGKISIQELKDAFAGMKLGLTKDEVDDVVRHVDKTGDGQIDFKEFIAALKL